MDQFRDRFMLESAMDKSDRARSMVGIPSNGGDQRPSRLLTDRTKYDGTEHKGVRSDLPLHLTFAWFSLGSDPRTSRIREPPRPRI